MTPIRATILLPILAALMLTTAAVRADDDDHKRVRRAFEAGEIVPLSAILKQIDPETDGDVLEVELEDDEGDIVVYEIKLLTADGRILERRFDARSGAPLEPARAED